MLIKYKGRYAEDLASPERRMGSHIWSESNLPNQTAVHVQEQGFWDSYDIHSISIYNSFLAPHGLLLESFQWSGYV